MGYGDGSPAHTVGITSDKRVTMDGRDMEIRFKRSGWVRMGCHNVHIDALREVVARYDLWRDEDEFVMQKAGA